MDKKTLELIEETKKRLGLDYYYLARYSFYRDVNIFNETNYTLSMEWFPNHEAEWEDDELNPDGTAVISMDVNSNKFKSIIFVGGKSYANEMIVTRDNVISWIELETGLKFDEHFRLLKEDSEELHFIHCIDGIKTSPSGMIEVEFDKQGKLIHFSTFGQYPIENAIEKGIYTLTLNKIKDLAKQQLKLIEFPSFEQEKLLPIYAVEEVYIKNDDMTTIPFEVFVQPSPSLDINIEMCWDTPIEGEVIREEIQLIDEVSEEQAFSGKPSIDTKPITKIEKEKSIEAVKDLLRQAYPKDSGKWNLQSLRRDKGYFHAVLRTNNKEIQVYQRKLTVVIDPQHFYAVNYIDNKMLLEMFDDFEANNEINTSKEVAYEKLKNLLELKPVYVYDFREKQYVLCGKLDCHHGIDASTGKIVELKDL